MQLEEGVAEPKAPLRRKRRSEGSDNAPGAGSPQPVKRPKVSQQDSAPSQAGARPRRSPATGDPGPAAACSTPSTPHSATPGPLERTASSPTTLLRPGSASRNVQKLHLGASVADNTDVSPSKRALAICDHVCPAPSSEPGRELVIPSMGILSFVTLLRSAGLMKDSDLSAYSQDMVRESALDKEFSDAMALCMKLIAMAILRYSDFSLPEVLPGVTIDGELANKRFLVPYGQLKVGKRLGHKLDAASTQIRINEISADIIKSQQHMDLEKDLKIGFVGTGNNGMDSCIVLVEAADSKRAWAISIQSKQDTSATVTYDTCRGILESMQCDLKATHKLPQLQGHWQSWHSSSKGASKGNSNGKGGSKSGAFPGGSPSAEGWDESDPQQRVIYAYVSDRLFSKEQDAVRRELLERGHPWMRRVVILCKWKQVAWYTRTGALLRYIR